MMTLLSFYVVILFILVHYISSCICSSTIKPSDVILHKRQASDEDINRLARKEGLKKFKQRREKWFKAKDDQSLKIAKQFLENDDIHLSDAMKDTNLHFTPSIEAQPHTPRSSTSKIMNELGKLISAPPTKNDKENETITQPFSNKVIRRGGRRSQAKGYHSNANMIALAAETSMIKGKTSDIQDAIKFGKEQIQKKNEKRKNYMSMWREIAKNNPSKAGEMKQEVPKALSSTLYVAARTHQIHQRGIVSDFKEAKQLALAESNDYLHKKKHQQRLTWHKTKQNNKST